VRSVCRSIKTLRPPFTDDVGPGDMRAAALQYVRKVVGMRSPAPHNAAAFEAAVDAVTAATEALLRDVTVRGSARRGPTTSVAGPGSSSS
jgi:hypothetical protein